MRGQPLFLSTVLDMQRLPFMNCPTRITDGQQASATGMWPHPQANNHLGFEDCEPCHPARLHSRYAAANHEKKTLCAAEARPWASLGTEALDRLVPALPKHTGVALCMVTCKPISACSTLRSEPSLLQDEHHRPEETARALCRGAGAGPPGEGSAPRSFPGGNKGLFPDAVGTAGCREQQPPPVSLIYRAALTAAISFNGALQVYTPDKLHPSLQHVTQRAAASSHIAGFLQVYTPDKLNQLMADSDYVVAALPSTSKTEGYISAEAIASMHSDAVFINIGRGKTVDEDALIEGQGLLWQLAAAACYGNLSSRSVNASMASSSFLRSLSGCVRLAQTRLSLMQPFKNAVSRALAWTCLQQNHYHLTAHSGRWTAC